MFGDSILQEGAKLNQNTKKFHVSKMCQLSVSRLGILYNLTEPIQNFFFFVVQISSSFSFWNPENTTLNSSVFKEFQQPYELCGRSTLPILKLSVITVKKNIYILKTSIFCSGKLRGAFFISLRFMDKTIIRWKKNTWLENGDHHLQRLGQWF